MTARGRQDPPLQEFPRDGAELRRRAGAGEKLGATVEIHKLLVDSIPDYAILALDAGGHVLTWNAGAELLKGYTADEIVGCHFSIFYPREAIESGHPEYALRVAAEAGRYAEEGWCVRRDGSRFWASIVITALRDEAGALVGFATVTRNLAERCESELRALEDARRIAEAEAANRAKSEFLAAMSHELRTPLNAIGGYTDLLALGIHGPITESQREALDRIRTSQQHLLGLITDLLNFSRLEAGRVTFHPQTVPLGNLVESVRPMIEPQAAGKEIAMEWPARDEAVVAIADKPRSEQILLNLLTNAVKYTEPGGRVAVRYFLAGDHVALEVSDTGIGIPEDKQEVIFEPFVQVGRSLTSPHEGTGLGLTISRDLARAMGGDLLVCSRVGEGSTFTLTLPHGGAGAGAD